MNSSFSLWLTKFSYSFPFINKVNSYSKYLNPDDNSWFKGEKSCCGDFSLHYWKSDDVYKKATDYLRKAREIDRKPMSLLIKLLIFGIMMLEAWGFSYVFAGYAIPGASPKIQEYGALGIAIFIAIVLSVLTHEAGKEWYANYKLRELAKLKGHANHSIENQEITIEDTYSDNDNPEYSKLHNRIGLGVEIKYNFTIIATIFIIIIAIGAVFVRQEALEEQIRVLQMTAEIPMTQINIDKMRSAGWATFGVLSVVFMFLQLIGAVFGNKFDFLGKESRKAYDIVHKFNTSQDFEDRRALWNKNVAELAEKYLSEIQRAINIRIQKINIGANTKQAKALSLMPEKTFQKYIKNLQDNKDVYSVVTKQKASPPKSRINKDDFFAANNNKSTISQSSVVLPKPSNTSVEKVSREKNTKSKNDFFDSRES